jgi:hypothetical protein
MKTIEDFLEALKQTPRTWRVNTDLDSGLNGCIRTGSHHTYQCPITAVIGRLGVDAPVACGHEWGLSTDDAAAIANAADGTNKFDPELRLRLLDACGIAE